MSLGEKHQPVRDALDLNLGKSKIPVSEISPGYLHKIDLAPLVGANLGVMESDTLRMRGKRPFVFSNLKNGEGVEPIANFIIEKGGLAKNAA